MQEPTYPHPLDADDDDDENSKRRWQSDSANPIKAYQPLLKPSLRFAALATVVLAISSVLTSVFPYGTQAYAVSLTVFRTSGAALVLALLAVLVAFRIGFVHSRPDRVRRRAVTRLGGYGRFVLVNLLGLAMAWILLLWVGWEFGSVAVIIASPILLIGAGLLGTMIATHTGYLRAYAIGALVAVALQATSFSSLSTMLFMGGGFGGRSVITSRGFDTFSIMLGGVLTIVIASGLISSAYVFVLTARTRRQNEIAELHDPADSSRAGS